MPAAWVTRALRAMVKEAHKVNLQIFSRLCHGIRRGANPLQHFAGVQKPHQKNGEREAGNAGLGRSDQY